MMKISYKTRSARLLSTMGAIALTLMPCGMIQAQPIPVDGVRIVAVRHLHSGSLELSVRIHVEDCHSIKIPPETVGPFYELVRTGNDLELKIGFVPFGVVMPCGTPENPTVYELPLGALEPGQYSLQLIGVDTSDFNAEYSLDSTVFGVVAPAHAIPAAGWTSSATLGLLLGAFALVALQRR